MPIDDRDDISRRLSMLSPVILPYKDVDIVFRGRAGEQLRPNVAHETNTMGIMFHPCAAGRWHIQRIYATRSVGITLSAEGTYFFAGPDLTRGRVLAMPIEIPLTTRFKLSFEPLEVRDVEDVTTEVQIVLGGLIPCSVRAGVRPL